MLWKGLKIIGWILLVFLLALLALGLFSRSFVTDEELVDKRFCEPDTNILKALTIEECPADIQPAAKIALSAYPELKNTSIKFEYATFRSVNAIMAAQPIVNFKMFNKKTREYVIYINNTKESAKESFFTNLPFEIQAGWLAHELAHILDYSDRSFLSMLGFVFNYIVNPGFIKKIERATDLITVNRGLGDELKTGVEFLLINPAISKEYKNKIQLNYLSVEEMQDLIQEYEEACAMSNEQ